MAESSTKPYMIRALHEWCTDNGAMIAMAAGMRLQQGIEQAHTSYAFDVLPRWPLAQI